MSQPFEMSSHTLCEGPFAVTVDSFGIEKPIVVCERSIFGDTALAMDPEEARIVAFALLRAADLVAPQDEPFLHLVASAEE